MPMPHITQPAKMSCEYRCSDAHVHVHITQHAKIWVLLRLPAVESKDASWVRELTDAPGRQCTRLIRLEVSYPLRPLLCGDWLWYPTMIGKRLRRRWRTDLWRLRGRWTGALDFFVIFFSLESCLWKGRCNTLRSIHFSSKKRTPSIYVHLACECLPSRTRRTCCCR